MTEVPESARGYGDWWQGSLLPDATLPGIGAWILPQQQDSNELKKEASKLSLAGSTAPILVERKLPSDRLMVITHTCDIRKKSPNFPVVYVARVFATTKSDMVARARFFGSARYFFLNPVAGSDASLILDFCWQIAVDKALLRMVASDNSLVNSWSDDQRRTLARWLGDRFSRPELSDEDTRQISDPVRGRLQQLMETEPERARRFSEAYPEIRFQRVTTNTSDDLYLSLISSESQLDEVMGLEFGNLLCEALQQHPANVRSTPHSYDTFTLRQIADSQQLPLEWASHDEEGIAGALPEDV